MIKKLLKYKQIPSLDKLGINEEAKGLTIVEEVINLRAILV